MNAKTERRELDGHIALVTGGALNIGRATCLDLAAGGAKVCVNAATSGEAAKALAEEINAAGGQAMHYVADIRVPEQVKAMTDAVVEHFGGLTILINNASLRKVCKTLDMTLEDWRAVMAVTVEGSFLCSQAAIPHLRKAKKGSIVMMSGVAANLGVQDRLHAATANGALIAMAKSLAKEMAPYNVTVNALSPGYIDTVRGASSGSYPPGSRPTDNLAGRMGKPEEIAGMIRALVGPGGAYTTGQSLHINGGVYMQ